MLVEPRGSKLWRLAYRFNGKQKTLSLGIYPAVSLKEARDHRERAKELLARGIDPGEHKKQEKRKSGLRPAIRSKPSRASGSMRRNPAGRPAMPIESCEGWKQTS